MRKRKIYRPIKASSLPTSVIGMAAPVQIVAGEGEGEAKGPAKFSATFYTGGPLTISGWDLPVVVDLAGLDRGNVLVANLDHDATKRVGNFDVTNDGRSLTAHGTATARTPARDEVIGSAEDGYQWQASLEVNPRQVEILKTGKTATVNGQQVVGPMYITRKGVLKGFAFVSHGADDNTTVAIAASAAEHKGKTMKAEARKWAEEHLMLDVDSLTPEQVAAIEENYEGRNAPPPKKISAADPFAARKLEAKRRADIREIADRFIDLKAADYEEITAIEKMHNHAIDAGMTPQEFRLELYESSVPLARTVPSSSRDRSLTNRVLEAAICQTGRLRDVERKYSDQELQLAHDHFPHGISLGQLFILAAEANGYRANGGKVTLDVQRAAFRLGQPQIRAAGFSTIDIATIVSNTANKFLMDGWNAVDQTPLRIAKIQPVNDFKTITTVSLTDNVRYEKVGPDGEIKHGTLDELTYTNKADTYARMLAITRTDIINDDLGALTAVPRKLGNGAMKLLNHIFWEEFLGAVSASFFASGNSNLLDGVATMTTEGLARAEALFMNQTNPDGTPLGVMPAILLVPTALKSAAFTLMSSERLIDGTATATQGDANIWRGRFRVESSPYISNSTYTGNTTAGWWMLAEPNDLPVIAIAALNGRVEPTVDTADADFNVLGVQMRGYSDVGVNLQEYRGGVYADGGSS